MKKSENLHSWTRITPQVTAPTSPSPPGWTFLTNHTHVLLCLYRQPNQRLRDVAAAVGITERMVQRVISELVEAGYVAIHKEGRCNRYTVKSGLQLRHPLEKQHSIGELLSVLSATE